MQTCFNLTILPIQVSSYIFADMHYQHTWTTKPIINRLKILILLNMDSLKVLCFMFCMMVVYVSSDITQDKKRCQNQLIGLSSCLTFASGEAKFPTPACCAELRKDLKETKLCLCVLVKDRNDPDLGFKINGTLALSLPSICRAPTNVSECLGKSFRSINIIRENCIFYSWWVVNGYIN